METTQENMIVSFDTLAASKKLRESGMPMSQAEAVSEVTATAVDGLVTGNYLDLRLSLVEKGLLLSQARWSLTIIASQIATISLLIGYLSISG